MNFDPNAIDFSGIFREAFKDGDYRIADSTQAGSNSHRMHVEKFKQEMKTIAEERRISNGIAKARERIRKQKLDEPFELGGAL